MNCQKITLKDIISNLRPRRDNKGLATLDGLQFVLPQVVAQSLPNQSDPLDAPGPDGAAAFDSETPLRAVLLDGTPVAGHRSLDGGVVIEDVHDLVGRSVVAQRRHATSMASLILRGDLTADGVPVEDSRLLCIPVLVDAEGRASSPEDRLFVDVVHVALTRALAGAEPLAPEAFVVNFSVGIRRSGFSGRISSLARLAGGWAHSEGVLFVVSSGNVLEDLGIPGMTSVAFEEATLQERRELIAAAQRAGRHERTLLAPSEALNALTVGAASVDLAPAVGPRGRARWPYRMTTSHPRQSPRLTDRGRSVRSSRTCWQLAAGTMFERLRRATTCDCASCERRDDPESSWRRRGRGRALWNARAERAAQRRWPRARC